MKFRLDFVTNSSSSSYIAITIKSADLCKVISLYNLLDLSGQSIRCWTNNTVMFDSEPDRYDLYDAVPYSRDDLPETILHWLNEFFFKIPPEAQAVVKASIKNAEYVEMISNFTGEDLPRDNIYCRGVLNHGEYNRESNKWKPFRPDYNLVSGPSEIIIPQENPLPDTRWQQAAQQNDSIRKDWEYELDSAFGHTITITKYKGNDTRVVIPAEIDGYQVQRLEGAAWSLGGHIIGHESVFPSVGGHNNICEVVIPEGVASIGDSSFCECTYLESVILPTTLRAIGNLAFSSCSSLEAIHLPDSVESIGDQAFFNCESLKEINIPANLQFVGDSAFSWCSKLFPEKRFLIVNGVLFDIRGSETCVALPDGIKFLSQRAIPNTVKELCIPDTCTSPREAPSLIQKSVERLQGALMAKTNLERVLLPEGIENIDYALFAHDTALKDIIIPASVRTIHPIAFIECSQLQSVIILNGTEKIDHYAFMKCPKLSKVYLPLSVKEIDDEAFPHRKTLKFITPEGSYAESYAKKFGISYSNEIPKELPDIKKLKEEFLKNHPISLELTYYKSIDLEPSDCDTRHTNPQTPEHDSDNQSSQSENSLFPNLSFKEADIAWDYDIIENPEKNTFEIEIRKYKSHEVNVVAPGHINGGVVRSIGPATFYGITSIETITLPPTIQGIGQQAFGDCFSLKTITLPDNISNIGVLAFSGCMNLESVILPSKIEQIMDSAFHCCERLVSITIPSNTKKICSNAFRYSGLANVSFESDSIDIERRVALGNISKDKNILLLESGAFWGCKNLSDQNGFVIVKGILFDYFGNIDTTTTNGYIFHQVKQIARLIIPSEVKIIDSNALDRVREIVKEVALPLGLQQICAGAFSCFSLLTTISLPSSISEIAPNTFNHCVSLEKIEIPGNISVIDKGAFGDCAKLTQVILREGVKIISRNVFSNCPTLKEVQVPNSVVKIDKDTFSHSSNVKFFVEKGSFAESYAIRYNIPYVVQTI